MTTPTSTPPPAPLAGRQRGAATAIVVTTAVAGGIALSAVGVSTAVDAFAPDSSDIYVWEAGSGISGSFDSDGFDDYAELYESDLDGLRGLDIDATAAEFTIRFDDVDEAMLTVESTPLAADWTMYRDDEDLVIEHPDASITGTTEGCLFGCSANAGLGDVTLTLPQRFADTGGLSADISVAAGELHGEGVFDELDLSVSAGSLSFTGSARTLDLSVKVGEARVELADTAEADVEVETGDAAVTLTGDAPRMVEASAEMGSLRMTLPDEEYRTDLSGALGDIDNRLAENEKSDRLVRVLAKAAEVTLR
ncbi:MAG: hypothetical protein QM606_08425 [Leucobacter sp.]